jgi:hypothetical protein
VTNGGKNWSEYYTWGINAKPLNDKDLCVYRQPQGHGLTPALPPKKV